MEIEKDNSSYYKYSENGIKRKNYELWLVISKYINDPISFKEKFYLYENKLKNTPKCYCGNNVKFIDMISGYREFCSKKCLYNSKKVKEKRRQTNLEKYGVDNVSKIESIKEKVKQTNIDKFGVEYPMQSEKIKQKSKDHFLKKYGVDNPSKLKHVREKMKKTMLEKYGIKHALQSEEFLNKLIQTNIKKYGKKSFTSTLEYKDMIKNIIFKKNYKLINNNRYELLDVNNTEFKIFCNRCNSSFLIQRQLYRNRIKNDIEVCLNCNPIYNITSIAEKEILNFIKENYNDIILENHKINNKELDIYLPKLKIGIEYNGLYWHSELHKNKNYHKDKSEFFEKNGINLIHIWEDDWLYKKEIVKSMLLNKICKTSNKIWARKCEIKEINDINVARDFLNKNHIQGHINSKVYIGLYLNNSLVSLMTFGNLRISLGQRSKPNSYELFRFCNKLNTTVVGGASKLFKYFIKKYNPHLIISYSLNSYSKGDLYKKLNFYLKHETGTNYYWCKDGVRYHRFNFRKDKLVKDGFDKNKSESEIMYNRGYFKLYDGGSKKWELCLH